MNRVDWDDIVDDNLAPFLLNLLPVRGGERLVELPRVLLGPRFYRGGHYWTIVEFFEEFREDFGFDSK